MHRFTALILATASALAQTPSNDACASAAAAAPGTVAGTTLGATASVPAPTGCSSFGAATADVWYTITSPTTRWLYIMRTGTGADRLAVYNGSCGSLNQVACVSSNLTAVVLASAGVTYRIRVGQSIAAMAGPFELQITSAAPPTNDNCAGAIPVFDGVNPSAPSGMDGFTFTNFPSTESVGVEPSCSPNGPLKDVFFTYTATSLTTTVSTYVPGFVPGAQPPGSAPFFAQVFASPSCGGASPLVCSSFGSFASTPGAQYFIRVSCSGGVTGTFYVRIKPFGSAPVTPSCGVSSSGVAPGLSTNLGQLGVTSPIVLVVEAGMPVLWAGLLAPSPFDLSWVQPGCSFGFDPATMIFIDVPMNSCTSFVPGVVCYSVNWQPPIDPALIGLTFWLQGANLPSDGSPVLQMTSIVQVTLNI